MVLSALPPKADKRVDVSLSPLCAISDRTQRSKPRPHAKKKQATIGTAAPENPQKTVKCSVCVPPNSALWSRSRRGGSLGLTDGRAGAGLDPQSYSSATCGEPAPGPTTPPPSYSQQLSFIIHDHAPLNSRLLR